MDFGFFKDQDRTRYCYLRLRRLKEAIKDPKILDALLRELEVLNSGALSPRQKLAAIERQIDGLRADKTSTWFGVPAPEVLAAAIFGARRLAGDAAAHLFSEVAQKEDLVAPVTSWLSLVGFAPYTNIPAEITRTDLIAVQTAQMMSKPRIMGIELLNDASLLPASLERMKACVEYTHTMNLACTPATAADILLAHAKAANVSRWDAGALHERLSGLGFGLLLVEGDAVSEPLTSATRDVNFLGAAKKLTASR